MNIAVVGSQFLTATEARTARILIDAILCRYSNGVSSLVTGGRAGIEKIALELAETWNIITNVPELPELSGTGKVSVLKNRKLDKLILEKCDLLFSIRSGHREPSSIINRADKWGKQAVEIFV